MGPVGKVLQDSLTGIIVGSVLGSLAVIAAIIFGSTPDAILAKAFTTLQLPHWLVWGWIFVTVVLSAIVVSSAFRKRPQPVEATVSVAQQADPKIEILTGDGAPYNTIEMGQGVASKVLVGIKNGGGKTLSNCRVNIQAISPPTKAVSGDVRFLEGGFQLRHDDPEHHVPVAYHWGNTDHYRFSEPHSGAFFDSSLLMDDKVKRTIEIKVKATECERSALFEIWADESKRMHLEFLNYLN
jgi:hypothetical protein